MPIPEFAGYLDQIQEQIRWRRAHGAIRRELEDHLEDQYQALLREGVEQAEAVECTLREMGPAAEIGPELDRAYRPRPAWGILALALLLLVGGFAVHQSILFATGVFVRPLYYLFLLGLHGAALLAGYFLDYTILFRRPLVGYLGYLGLATLLLWLEGMNPGIRPLYLSILFFFPLAYLGLLSHLLPKGLPGLLLCGVAYLAGCRVMLSMSCLLINSITCLVLLTAAVCGGTYPLRKRVALPVIYGPVLLAAVFALPWLTGRLPAVLHPELEPAGQGYLGVVVKEILGSSRWLGQGGWSSENVLFDSLFTSEYTLAYLAHRFGWLAFLAVVACLLLLLVLCWSRTRGQSSQAARLTAQAILLVEALQILFYLLSNLGIRFVGGYHLPLLGSASAAAALNTFLVGLMLSVFRCGHLQPDSAVCAGEKGGVA